MDFDGVIARSIAENDAIDWLDHRRPFLIAGCLVETIEFEGIESAARVLGDEIARTVFGNRDESAPSVIGQELFDRSRQFDFRNGAFAEDLDFLGCKNVLDVLVGVGSRHLPACVFSRNPGWINVEERGLPKKWDWRLKAFFELSNKAPDGEGLFQFVLGVGGT